jgi:hypothetical protein
MDLVFGPVHHPGAATGPEADGTPVMMVLFLGGPWHNQRHEVMPIRMSAALLPTHFTVLNRDGDTPFRRHVTYTRRFVRSGEERRPVYVSADYRGAARA